ncbi:MAG: ribonuclease HI family protein [Myxococcota bacterium]|nr:ribonuclease HI family protein [Myxococcota bacterium]
MSDSKKKLLSEFSKRCLEDVSWLASTAAKLDGFSYSELVDLLRDFIIPENDSTSNTSKTAFSGSWARLHTDGAARGNPGPAAAGWVLYGRDGSEIAAGGERLGKKTNNEAEYLALLVGVRESEARGISTLEICIDSELVVKQILGIYRVKNVRLKPFYDEILHCLRAFESWTIAHVRREYNVAADREANKALDNH